MDTKQIVAYINKHWPQAGVINDVDKIRFADHLVQYANAQGDPAKTIGFAIERHGIGGSEAVHGVNLVLMQLGESPLFSFQPMNYFARSKLMRVMPIQASLGMKIGTALESVTIQHILENGLWKRRPEIESAIREFRSTKYPWIAGNPDLVVEDKHGKIFIVDVKVPAEQSKEVYDAYQIQLSYYRMIAEILIRKGRIPNMEWECLLMPLDIPSRTVKEKTVPAEVIKGWIPMIVEGCDSLYNDYIMKGEIPWPSLSRNHNTNDIEGRGVIDPGTPVSMQEEVDALSKINALQDSLKDAEKNIKNYIIEIMSGPFEKNPAISQRKKETILPGLAISYIESMGLNPRDYMKPDIIKAPDDLMSAIRRHLGDNPLAPEILGIVKEHAKYTLDEEQFLNLIAFVSDKTGLNKSSFSKIEKSIAYTSSKMPENALNEAEQMSKEIVSLIFKPEMRNVTPSDASTQAGEPSLSS